MPENETEVTMETTDPVREVSNKYLGSIGRTGLTRFGGSINEEWLSDLAGSKGQEIYKKMATNDPIVGAMMFAVRMLVGQVKFWVEPGGSKTHTDKEAAEFVQSCLHDMDVPFVETLGEILTCLPYGWSVMELVFKKREGFKKINSLNNSQYTDGRVGWEAWAPRAQESLYEWVYKNDASDELVAFSQMPAPDYIVRTIPRDKFLHFTIGSSKRNPEGQSVLRTAYRAWYMKTNLEDIEAIGIERDLAGLPIAWVPENVARPRTDDATALAALESFKKLVSNLRRDEEEGIVMPSTTDEKGNRIYDIKLLGTGGMRQFNTTQIINRWNSAIAMTLLADFLLLGQQKAGSYALASTKTDLFTTALKSILDGICDVINSHAIPQLMQFNTFDITGTPKLVHGKVNVPDLEQLGTFITRMAGAGARVFPNAELEESLYKLADLPPKGDALQAINDNPDLRPLTDEEKAKLGPYAGTGGMENVLDVGGDKTDLPPGLARNTDKFGNKPTQGGASKMPVNGVLGTKAPIIPTHESSIIEENLEYPQEEDYTFSKGTEVNTSKRLPFQRENESKVDSDQRLLKARAVGGGSAPGGRSRTSRGTQSQRGSSRGGSRNCWRTMSQGPVCLTPAKGRRKVSGGSTTKPTRNATGKQKPTKKPRTSETPTGTVVPKDKIPKPKEPSAPKTKTPTKTKTSIAGTKPRVPIKDLKPTASKQEVKDFWNKHNVKPTDIVINHDKKPTDIWYDGKNSDGYNWNIRTNDIEDSSRPYVGEGTILRMNPETGKYRVEGPEKIRVEGGSAEAPRKRSIEGDSVPVKNPNRTVDGGQRTVLPKMIMDDEPAPWDKMQELYSEWHDPVTIVHDTIGPDGKPVKVIFLPAPKEKMGFGKPGGGYSCTGKWCEYDPSGGSGEGEGTDKLKPPKEPKEPKEPKKPREPITHWGPSPDSAPTAPPKNFMSAGSAGGVTGPERNPEPWGFKKMPGVGYKAEFIPLKPSQFGGSPEGEGQLPKTEKPRHGDLLERARIIFPNPDENGKLPWGYEEIPTQELGQSWAFTDVPSPDTIEESFDLFSERGHGYFSIAGIKKDKNGNIWVDVFNDHGDKGRAPASLWYYNAKPGDISWHMRLAKEDRLMPGGYRKMKSEGDIQEVRLETPTVKRGPLWDQIQQGNFNIGIPEKEGLYRTKPYSFPDVESAAAWLYRNGVTPPKQWTEQELGLPYETESIQQPSLLDPESHAELMHAIGSYEDKLKSYPEFEPNKDLILFGPDDTFDESIWKPEWMSFAAKSELDPVKGWIYWLGPKDGEYWTIEDKDGIAQGKVHESRIGIFNWDTGTIDFDESEGGEEEKIGTPIIGGLMGSWQLIETPETLPEKFGINPTTRQPIEGWKESRTQKRAKMKAAAEHQKAINEETKRLLEESEAAQGEVKATALWPFGKNKKGDSSQIQGAEYEIHRDFDGTQWVTVYGYDPFYHEDAKTYLLEMGLPGDFTNKSRKMYIEQLNRSMEEKGQRYLQAEGPIKKVEEFVNWGKLKSEQKEKTYNENKPWFKGTYIAENETNGNISIKDSQGNFKTVPVNVSTTGLTEDLDGVEVWIAEDGEVSLLHPENRSMDGTTWDVVDDTGDNLKLVSQDGLYEMEAPKQWAEKTAVVGGQLILERGKLIDPDVADQIWTVAKVEQGEATLTNSQKGFFRAKAALLPGSINVGQQLWYDGDTEERLSESNFKEYKSPVGAITSKMIYFTDEGEQWLSAEYDRLERIKSFQREVAIEEEKEKWEAYWDNKHERYREYLLDTLGITETPTTYAPIRTTFYNEANGMLYFSFVDNVDTEEAWGEEHKETPYIWGAPAEWLGLSDQRARAMVEGGDVYYLGDDWSLNVIDPSYDPTKVRPQRLQVDSVAGDTVTVVTEDGLHKGDFSKEEIIGEPVEGEELYIINGKIYTKDSKPIGYWKITNMEQTSSGKTYLTLETPGSRDSPTWKKTTVEQAEIPEGRKGLTAIDFGEKGYEIVQNSQKFDWDRRISELTEDGEAELEAVKDLKEWQDDIDKTRTQFRLDNKDYFSEEDRVDAGWAFGNVKRVVTEPSIVYDEKSGDWLVAPDAFDSLDKIAAWNIDHPEYYVVPASPDSHMGAEGPNFLDYAKRATWNILHGMWPDAHLIPGQARYDFEEGDQPYWEIVQQRELSRASEA